MKACPSCGIENKDSSTYCRECGGPLGSLESTVVDGNAERGARKRRKRRLVVLLAALAVAVIAAVITALVILLPGGDSGTGSLERG